MDAKDRLLIEQLIEKMRKDVNEHEEAAKEAFSHLISAETAALVSRYWAEQTQALLQSVRSVTPHEPLPRDIPAAIGVLRSDGELWEALRTLILATPPETVTPQEPTEAIVAAFNEGFVHGEHRHRLDQAWEGSETKRNLERTPPSSPEQP